MKFQFNIDLTDKDYTDFNVFCAAASVGFSAESIISGTLLLIIPQLLVANSVQAYLMPAICFGSDIKYNSFKEFIKTNVPQLIHINKGEKMKSYTTKSPEETESIGFKLAQTLRGGEVIAFRGGLGMGKTCFTRGLARGLGFTGTVTSPTFALINEYIGGRLPLYHFDMYRISGWEDLYSTGFFEYAEQGGVIAAEWSENIENALPADTVTVTFEQTGENERVINIDGARDLDLTETETQ